MRDAGGELAYDCELAGLHQFVLCFAQCAFHAHTLADFVAQKQVAGGEVGGALGDLALQFVVRALQFFPRGQPFIDVAAAFVDDEREQQQ